MSTGRAENPTVDVHAHILLPALQQLVAEADPEGFGAQQALEVRRNGPESMAASGKMIKERWPQLTDLDRRLADMDAQGVDVQLVSPSPSHFYYFAAEELALQVAKAANQAEPKTWGEVGTLTLIPAFVLSELKTAFLLGFKIYLPFLIIDMVISAVLISMGMMMLPPVLISLPFKLLLFVLVDGWHLITGSLMGSFVM